MTIRQHARRIARRASVDEQAHRLRDVVSRLATPSRAGAEPDDPLATSVSDLCRSITASARRRATASCCWGTRALPDRADTRLRRRDQEADRGVRCRDGAHPLGTTKLPRHGVNCEGKGLSAVIIRQLTVSASGFRRLRAGRLGCRMLTGSPVIKRDSDVHQVESF
jgi:hypothetical protein